MSIDDLILNLGGPAVVSRFIGVSMQAVCNWVRRNEIPPGRQLEIWRMAAERGIDWRPAGVPVGQAAEAAS